MGQGAFLSGVCMFLHVYMASLWVRCPPTLQRRACELATLTCPRVWKSVQMVVCLCMSTLKWAGDLASCQRAFGLGSRTPAPTPRPCWGRHGKRWMEISDLQIINSSIKCFCNGIISNLKKRRFRSICPSENSSQHPISSAEGPLKSYITVTQKRVFHVSLERFSNWY